MNRTIKRVIKGIFSRCGYEIRAIRPSRGVQNPYWRGYDLEPEAYAAIQKVRAHTMVTYERLVVLYQQVVHCERFNVRGCYVECGTWRGGSVGVMALANLAHGGSRRHLHLFDSFEGIPEPSAEADGEAAVKWAASKGAGAAGRLVPIEGAYDSIGTLEVNRELLEQQIGYNTDFLHYHKGWFQQTVPADAGEIGDIAILRLDGDW